VLGLCVAASVGLVTGGNDDHSTDLRTGHSPVRGADAGGLGVQAVDGLDAVFLHALAAHSLSASGRTPTAGAGEPSDAQTDALAGDVRVDGPAVATLAVEALIRAAFGEHGEEALRIAECESRMDPNAVSYDGSSFGLFQLHAPTWARVFPDFWQQWSDPQWNIEHAKLIFERAGSFSPWECW